MIIRYRIIVYRYSSSYQILRFITIWRLITIRKIFSTLDSDRRSIRYNLHYLFFILPWPISVYLYYTNSTPLFLNFMHLFIFPFFAPEDFTRKFVPSFGLRDSFLNINLMHKFLTLTFSFTESFSNVSMRVLLFNSSDNSGFWPTPLLTSSFTCSSLH